MESWISLFMLLFDEAACRILQCVPVFMNDVVLVELRGEWQDEAILIYANAVE
jgi:hypothetical protein